MGNSNIIENDEAETKYEDSIPTGKTTLYRDVYRLALTSESLPLNNSLAR